MDILKLIFFEFLLFLAIHARNNCPSRFCGKSPVEVRFPFRLKDQQPQKCGYPGFDLSCQKSKIILNLPHSGVYYVRGINYLMQEIYLYDPNWCLPRRLLSLNLLLSPFVAAYYKNFTFLSCPSELVRTRLTTIDCLSNSTTSVVATSSMNLARALNNCSTIVSLQIPVSQPVQDEEWVSSDPSDELRLGWNVPRCEDCEARGGVCGFDNSTGEELVCYHHPRTVGSQRHSLCGMGVVDRQSNQDPIEKLGRLVLFFIALALAIPTVALSMSLLVYICIMARRINQHRANAAAHNTAIAAVERRQMVPGLDESSIESYTKVVLGESRRLPGPNGVTCPICLADYHPNETIRCMPECEHCFHSDCVDEWLRMQNTCPVCRNSPSPNRAIM
ncbi:hypothetical protein CDL12_25322 [Handroanthus impetiginosus]|uniref:RING-type domain-containing protein n=1 Tax=Handroanthus impetiginosus TaxID=429701 RepID=A0A2G9GAD9_9LAMI|nr:hypothetical protein CDL12_25322 [Handroanthus impetiginosus]